MTTHIKRDGGWICKYNKYKHSYSFKNDNDIKFSKAHSMDISYICPDCQKRYYEILDNLPPIVI